jgi:hypothetical protein
MTPRQAHRVLVAGADGTLGPRLLSALAVRGHRVFHVEDPLDRPALFEAVRAMRPTVVVHVASRPTCIRDLADAAERHGVQRLVSAGASSCPEVEDVVMGGALYQGVVLRVPEDVPEDAVLDAILAAIDSAWGIYDVEPAPPGIEFAGDGADHLDRRTRRGA